MAAGTVKVIAQFRAKPGQEQSVKDILRPIPIQVRRALGCMGFEMLEGLNDPALFVFIEEWGSETAVDDHMSKPVVLEVLANLAPLLAGEPDWKRFSPVAPQLPA